LVSRLGEKKRSDKEAEAAAQKNADATWTQEEWDAWNEFQDCVVGLASFLHEYLYVQIANIPRIHWKKTLD